MICYTDNVHQDLGWKCSYRREILTNLMAMAMPTCMMASSPMPNYMMVPMTIFDNMMFSLTMPTYIHDVHY